MAFDGEPNNTLNDASGGGLLSLFSGKADDTTFGKLSGLGDPRDFYRYATRDGLQSVKATISMDLNDSNSVLGRGGIYAAVDKLVLRPGGSFSGKAIEIEIHRGNTKRGEKATDAAESLLFEMLDRLATTDVGDGIMQEQANFLARLMDAFSPLFEFNGTNGDARQVVDNLTSMLANLNVQGGPYLPKVVAAGKELLEAAKIWDETTYFMKNGSGKLVEVSALAISKATTNWSVSGGGDGYLIVEGSSRGFSIDQLNYSYTSSLFDLDYTAKISVQSEEQGRTGVKISGTSGSDTISTKATVPGQKKATQFDDTIKGYGGHDRISAGSGNDRLEGGSGKDTMKGENGNDKLYGGSGSDKLYGGKGADNFIFKSVKDSSVNSNGRDTIFDFNRSQNDKIDLKSIDANTKAGGDQSFKFIGTEKFHKKAGELRFDKKSGDTFIYGDINGDGKADFSIKLDSSLNLKGSDFIL